MSNWWLKDQDGNPSVIVTLVAVSFAATTVAYVTSFIEHIGPIAIRPFDPTAAGAYFGAVLAAYVGHRWVDSKYNGVSGPTDPPAPPAGG